MRAHLPFIIAMPFLCVSIGSAEEGAPSLPTHYAEVVLDVQGMT